MKPVSGENRFDAESTTGAHLHQLETSQVSRGYWRGANARPHTTGEWVHTGRRTAETIMPRVASPAALLCNFAWLVQRLFASCSGHSLALSCLGYRFGAPVFRLARFFLLLPKPQPATHGLKIHGLASPRQMPQLSDFLLRIYEVLLVRRALGLSIF